MIRNALEAGTPRNPSETNGKLMGTRGLQDRKEREEERRKGAGKRKRREVGGRGVWERGREESSKGGEGRGGELWPQLCPRNRSK